MTDELRSVLLGTAGLSAGAVVALYLTLARGLVAASGPQLRDAVRVAVAAMLAQALHFAEELATGFHLRFPEALGLAPWSLGFFVPFNLAWLAIFALGIRGMSARRRAALFPLWFLAIAGVVNGVAHPLLALRAGGYFPGLVTSPFVGLAGVLLFRRLLEITEGARTTGPEDAGRTKSDGNGGVGENLIPPTVSATPRSTRPLTPRVSSPPPRPPREPAP